MTCNHAEQEKGQEHSSEKHVECTSIPHVGLWARGSEPDRQGLGVNNSKHIKMTSDHDQGSDKRSRGMR